mgnify:CR=1 FL=1
MYNYQITHFSGNWNPLQQHKKGTTNYILSTIKSIFRNLVFTCSWKDNRKNSRKGTFVLSEELKNLPVIANGKAKDSVQDTDDRIC